MGLSLVFFLRENEKKRKRKKRIVVKRGEKGERGVGEIREERLGRA